MFDQVFVVCDGGGQAGQLHVAEPDEAGHEVEVCSLWLHIHITSNFLTLLFNTFRCVAIP